MLSFSCFNWQCGRCRENQEIFKGATCLHCYADMEMEAYENQLFNVKARTRTKNTGVIIAQEDLQAAREKQFAARRGGISYGADSSSLLPGERRSGISTGTIDVTHTPSVSPLDSGV